MFGRGGPVPMAKPLAPPRADGRLDLAGGRWRVQRDSLVRADGRRCPRPASPTSDWVVATVPGTVLTSYCNAGRPARPELRRQPADDLRLVLPRGLLVPQRVRRAAARARAPRWLNFDGVNWKAEVFLNGERLGRIDGGFTRARFDVTGRLRAGQTNALAVRVEKPATPGSVKEKTFENPDKNGGALGADNPTYHASIGWDWIPTIRGRNTGIWNDVYVTNSGPVDRSKTRR